MKEYASDQLRILVSDREIKKTWKPWKSEPQSLALKNIKSVQSVQIRETIHFILFGDDSITTGQSNMRRFIYERSATNIHFWSLAYSFINILYVLYLREKFEKYKMSKHIFTRGYSFNENLLL